jgi:hypothetical protein
MQGALFVEADMVWRFPRNGWEGKTFSPTRAVPVLLLRHNTRCVRDITVFGLAPVFGGA